LSRSGRLGFDAARFEADHLLPEPLDCLPGVGFEIDEVECSKWA
jgi:hypothetical protein